MGRIVKNGVEYGRGGAELLNLIYPVGIIVDFGEEGKNFDPNVTWAPQKWKKLEDGRVTIASNSSYPVGTNGGSTTHLHSTKDHTLTVEEMPAHVHSFSKPAWANTEYRAGDRYFCAKGWNSISTETFGSTNYTGGSRAHNHGDTGSASTMQPYTAVNRWKRIS